MELDGKEYYFYSDGEMARNKWEKGKNGEWYYYGSDGASEIGWINVDGDDYYIDSDHQLAKSWMKQDGKWYYFDDSGKMKTGWQNIDGEDYYFYGDTGTMATEWSQLDGKMYYFDDNGKMQTGWLVDDETFYYCYSNGTAAKGWTEHDGSWYYFDEDSGGMYTGWLYDEDNDEIYYLTEDGTLRTHSMIIDDVYYMFDYDGKMLDPNDYDDGSVEDDYTIETGIDIALGIFGAVKAGVKYFGKKSLKYIGKKVLKEADKEAVEYGGKAAIQYGEKEGVKYIGKDAAKEVSKGGKYTNLDDGLNFSNKASEHMAESGRQVPVQTLQDAIKGGEALPDPRGSSATMYYTTMYKNGKMYNLEVLYDKTTNTVFHFEYARKAMGNLPAIK